MSAHGDYQSLAEAVGEAPPSGGGRTGDEFAELVHDAGGQIDEAVAIADEIDARHRADVEGWHRENGTDPAARIAALESEVEELQQQLDERRRS